MRTRGVVVALEVLLFAIVFALSGCQRGAPYSPGGVLIDTALSEADINSGEQARVLTEKANRILAEMKSVCAAKGLDFVGPDRFVPTGGRILQMSWENITGPEFQMESPDYSFHFWQRTNGLRLFYNKAYEKSSHASTLLQKTDSPKQNEQQTAELAKAFLPALGISSDILLGDPHGKFEPQYELPKYRFGFWTIAWPRLDQDGHVFGGDGGVSINLPEGYGPSSLAIGLAIPYVKQDGPRLSQAEALAKAREAIASNRAMITGSADKVTGDTVQSANLEIVEVSSRQRWFGTDQPSGARLAWVFWFDPVLANFKPGPTYDHRFEVSIDAYTGEMVGSDFML